MQKYEIYALIRQEMNEHPDITSFQLAEKCQIPLHIVQIVQNKIMKRDVMTPLK